MGLKPETIHRAIVISAGKSLFPHNGFLAVFNRLAGLTLRQSCVRALISLHVPHDIGIVICEWRSKRVTFSFTQAQLLDLSTAHDWFWIRKTGNSASGTETS